MDSQVINEVKSLENQRFPVALQKEQRQLINLINITLLLRTRSNNGLLYAQPGRDGLPPDQQRNRSSRSGKYCGQMCGTGPQAGSLPNRNELPCKGKPVPGKQEAIKVTRRRHKAAREQPTRDRRRGRQEPTGKPERSARRAYVATTAKRSQQPEKPARDRANKQPLWQTGPCRLGGVGRTEQQPAPAGGRWRRGRQTEHFPYRINKAPSSHRTNAGQGRNG